jgi:hypothetical protein
MIGAPEAPRLYTVASVPLRSECLRQASLFEAITYSLPTVLPGGQAVIVDADDWLHNFKKGTVIRYSYRSGLHTILFDSVSEGDFKGWEIMQAFGS